jgi:hypothetical protein
MRRRVRGLAAVVIASAAIGGMLAAPAPAARPQFAVSAGCVVEGGGFVSFATATTAGNAQLVIRSLSQFLTSTNSRCVPGTRQITIERL